MTRSPGIAPSKPRRSVAITLRSAAHCNAVAIQNDQDAGFSLGSRNPARTAQMQPLDRPLCRQRLDLLRR